MTVNSLYVVVDLNQIVFDNPGFTFHAWTLIRQSCSIPKPYQRSGCNCCFFQFLYTCACGTWLMGNHTFTMIVTHCLQNLVQASHIFVVLLFCYNYLHVYFLQMCCSDSSQNDNNEALLQYRPRA